MRPPPMGRLLAVLAVLLVGSLLLVGRERPVDAIVSGSNGRIAFESNRDGDYEIFTIEPDGTGLAKLTDNAVDDLNPAWSPDGGKIAFTRDKTDGTCASTAKCSAIFVMNADGSGVSQLTPFQGYLRDTGPAWSPDGSTILFSTTRPTNSGRRISSVPATGGGMTDLVTSGSDFPPDWKPDGTRFVFQSNREGSPRLYTASADGSDQTAVSLSGAQVPTRNIAEPSWSPDGTRFAFRGRELITDNTELYVSNANGSSTASLYDPGQWVYEPTWSPNGLKVVVSVDTEGALGSELRIVTVSNGNASTLASHAAEERNPAWQPTSGGGSPSPSPSPTSSPSSSPTTSPSPSTSSSPSPTSSPSPSSSPSPTGSPSPSPSPTSSPPPPPAGTHVDVDDNFFDPTPLRIGRGGTVVFDYVGSNQHTSTDATGMELFDSGPVAGGGTSTWHTFTAAGRYPFECTIHAQMDGQVKVPVRVRPGSGGRNRAYTVRVASEAARDGAVHDLQVKRPGSKRWRTVERGFTDETVSFRPDAGTGTYRFRARMRMPGVDASGWSPVARLRIS